MKKILFSVFLIIYSSNQMGQELSSKQNIENKQISSTLTHKSNLNICKNMSPLHYIKPIHFSFEDPSTSHDINTNSFSDDEDKQNLQDEIKIQGSPEIDTPHDQQQEIIYKKVVVKWNKFIKMKRKNFLSDYRVLKEIGRGGFGCVYKVIGKNGSIYRAAKKINKDKLQSDDHEDLLAEMAIMMHMDHPNISKLYEVYDHQNYYIMVLELCEGGELFDLIVQKSIHQSDAKLIMAQVLSALNYLHNKGIVHRDIKPENMLFQKKTKLIKIIDFGISAKINANKMLSSRIGTPYYIAPQVLVRKYNEKCDLWSLGVVLYMIIYNNPPFKGEEPMKVLESVARDQIQYKNPILHQFSYLSIDFLKKLLTRNPKSRLSAHQALQHKWLQKYNHNCVKVRNQESDKILERITKFHFKNKLQAVVYTYIVSQLLSSQQRYQLLSVFKSLDKNNNGIIQVTELKAALSQKTYFELTDEKIMLIKEYLDTNCSGFIDYTQFLVGAMDYNSKINEKHFEQAFAYFDIDNSGEITFQEVAKFLEDQVTNQEQIRKLFRQVDKNGDGVISRAEFVELLANKKLQKL